MRDVYTHSLESGAPLVEAPTGSLKVVLRAHQQAALSAMEMKEQSLMNGMDCSGETIFSSYAILGDSVGVGKSLMVLGHIARISTVGGSPPLKKCTFMGKHSTPNMFSIRTEEYKDISEAGCLIIVPHTLFRQWAGYIKTQTNLTAVCLDKRNMFAAEGFTQNVLGAQVVLISNTLYKEFSRWQVKEDVRWKRVFMDEADTIHMVQGYPLPPTRFTWFITASWMNLLFPNESLYLGSATLDTLIYSESSEYRCLRPFFDGLRGSSQNYTYLRQFVTSYNFLHDTLNMGHRLRGRLVVRCSDAFIKESISLPTLIRQIILCKESVRQQIVAGVLPKEVQELLHGGDVAAAIEALGVKAEETTNLVDAVTINLKKELERLNATYIFKAGLEYATEASKEHALITLKEKIARTEESIRSVEERVRAAATECCPICYEGDSTSTLLTPCCSRAFCGECIMACLLRTPDCPMCRARIHPSQLKRLAADGSLAAGGGNAIVAAGTSVPVVDEPKKKEETLLRLFEENPQGRFLVFSRYDNPFTEIEAQVDEIGVRVKQLKGTKDSIAATLRAFEKGDIRCLLLNSQYAGSGLNITAATHVVLLHAMTHEEEKQILGRAYRFGRTEPLHFIKLLHTTEVPVAN